jgi:hypothetical protein
VSLLRSNADRIAWERTSSRKRRTTAASVRLCVGGKFCRNKSCAHLDAIGNYAIKTHWENARQTLIFSFGNSLVVAAPDFNIYQLLA